MNLFHNVLLFCEIIFAQIGANLFGNGYDCIGNPTNWLANSLNQYSQFTHNLDGNLTNDCIFTYSYDAANRLSSVSSNGVVLVANQYDYKGRRIRKTTPTTETTFVYDGWNLIHETVATISGATTNTIEIQYFWGMDLSETLQGAGGVGGLLAVSCNNNFYFPAYDNNGNITKYIDENGSIVAAYEYDDFGRLISSSGPMSDFFRHRFSTKYFDVETGLYYYGYRFYSPSLMRWLNRDPIEEDGGLNLYGFCLSNSISFYDDLGGLVITGSYFLPEPSPSIIHQFGFAPLPQSEEKWFERNYAGWLAEARRRFSAEIEYGIDCKSIAFNGPSSRINIEPSKNRGGSTSKRTPGGNERKYGDVGQSDWSADKVLGRFSIDYVTPVKITYTNMGGGKRRYYWTTEMYIYDVLGLQEHDPIRQLPLLGGILGAMAPSRGVKRATWTLSGSGECDCNGGK